MNELSHMLNEIRRVSWQEINSDVQEAVKLTLIDSLGALIYGNHTLENSNYARRLEESEPGSCSVIGTGCRLSAKDAAFVNGCGSVASEMDEGHQWSKGHPAAHIVPLLLTAVQQGTFTGEHFLLSLLQGYEACSRFGRAVTLLPTAHAHGVWGCMGAAAAASFLNDSSEDEILEGVRLGASFALPTMWSAALEGALVRNAYMGHCIESALRVPALVSAGFRAPEGVIDYVFGTVLGKAFNYAALKSCAGEWEIAGNYFKPYAFCRYTHAPIDALGMILGKEKISPEAVGEITVETYSRASTLNAPAPANMLAAKFSIPYALAVRLVTGRADQNSFTEDLLQSEEILGLAGKISVKASAELEKEYPDIMPAVVRLTTREGGSFEARCDMAKGGPDNPFGRHVLEEKFRSLTGDILSSEEQAAVLACIWNLEELQNVSDLVEVCIPRVKSGAV